MLGWFSDEMARASRSKRCLASGLSERCAGRILMATMRSRRVSQARYTSPMPPAPSGDWISYGPSLVPEARAMLGRNYSTAQACSGCDGSVSRVRGPMDRITSAAEELHRRAFEHRPGGLQNWDDREEISSRHRCECGQCF